MRSYTITSLLAATTFLALAQTTEESTTPQGSYIPVYCQNSSLLVDVVRSHSDVQKKYCAVWKKNNHEVISHLKGLQLMQLRVPLTAHIYYWYGSKTYHTETLPKGTKVFAKNGIPVLVAKCGNPIEFIPQKMKSKPSYVIPVLPFSRSKRPNVPVKPILKPATIKPSTESISYVEPIIDDPRDPQLIENKKTYEMTKIKKKDNNIWAFYLPLYNINFFDVGEEVSRPNHMVGCPEPNSIVLIILALSTLFIIKNSKK